MDGVSKVSEVINKMGEASAAAQGLTKPITTADRLRNSEHKIYLLVEKDAMNGKGVITGMLKTGKKGLYVFDRDGHHYQVQPPCVLDFYIHESRQRTGLGKKLFEHMLQTDTVQPVKMAIDRPSEKFLGFLNKHYKLHSPIKQMNNYVVFDGFFPEPNHKGEPIESEDKTTPTRNQAANGLQSGHQASPYGRYGAPRPPCSMGQIIHNQSPLAQQPQEPAGNSLNIRPPEAKRSASSTTSQQFSHINRENQKESVAQQYSQGKSDPKPEENVTTTNDIPTYHIGTDAPVQGYLTQQQMAQHQNTLPQSNSYSQNNQPYINTNAYDQNSQPYAQNLAPSYTQNIPYSHNQNQIYAHSTKPAQSYTRQHVDDVYQTQHPRQMQNSREIENAMQMHQIQSVPHLHNAQQMLNARQLQNTQELQIAQELQNDQQVHRAPHLQNDQQMQSAQQLQNPHQIQGTQQIQNSRPAPNLYNAQYTPVQYAQHLEHAGYSRSAPQIQDQSAQRLSTPQHIVNTPQIQTVQQRLNSRQMQNPLQTVSAPQMKTVQQSLNAQQIQNPQYMHTHQQMQNPQQMENPPQMQSPRQPQDAQHIQSSQQIPNPQQTQTMHVVQSKYLRPAAMQNSQQVSSLLHWQDAAQSNPQIVQNQLHNAQQIQNIQPQSTSQMLNRQQVMNTQQWQNTKHKQNGLQAIPEPVARNKQTENDEPQPTLQRQTAQQVQSVEQMQTNLEQVKNAQFMQQIPNAQQLQNMQVPDSRMLNAQQLQHTGQNRNSLLASAQQYTQQLQNVQHIQNRQQQNVQNMHNPQQIQNVHLMPNTETPQMALLTPNDHQMHDVLQSRNGQQMLPAENPVQTTNIHAMPSSQQMPPALQTQHIHSLYNNQQNMQPLNAAQSTQPNMHIQYPPAQSTQNMQQMNQIMPQYTQAMNQYIQNPQAYMPYDINQQIQHQVTLQPPQSPQASPIQPLPLQSERTAQLACIPEEPEALQMQPVLPTQESAQPQEYIQPPYDSQQVYVPPTYKPSSVPQQNSHNVPLAQPYGDQQPTYYQTTLPPQPDQLLGQAALSQPDDRPQQNVEQITEAAAQQNAMLLQPARNMQKDVDNIQVVQQQNAQHPQYAQHIHSMQYVSPPTQQESPLAPNTLQNAVQVAPPIQPQQLAQYTEQSPLVVHDVQHTHLSGNVEPHYKHPHTVSSASIEQARVNVEPHHRHVHSISSPPIGQTIDGNSTHNTHSAANMSDIRNLQQTQRQSQYYDSGSEKMQTGYVEDLNMKQPQGAGAPNATGDMQPLAVQAVGS